MVAALMLRPLRFWLVVLRTLLAWIAPGRPVVMPVLTRMLGIVVVVLRGMQPRVALHDSREPDSLRSLLVPVSLALVVLPGLVMRLHAIRRSEPPARLPTRELVKKKPSKTPSPASDAERKPGPPEKDQPPAPDTPPVIPDRRLVARKPKRKP